MNILMIGNSYSVDCSRYLHRIARAGGAVINTTCLYIGGCPLDRHFRNMHSGEEAYELYTNGEPTGFKVSLGDVLINRERDVITFQQASGKSFDYETYQPYLDELADYARTLCPKAKFIIHQTWPDADTSPRLEGFGFQNNGEMFKALEAAYKKAAQAIGAEDIIRDGQLSMPCMKRACTLSGGITDIFLWVSADLPQACCGTRSSPETISGPIPLLTLASLSRRRM